MNKMICIIKIMIIIILSTLILEADTSCTKNLNNVKCRYDLVCEENHSIAKVRWQDFIRQFYYNDQNFNHCDNQNTINIHGNIVYTIDLVYKFTVIQDSVYIIPDVLNNFNYDESFVLKLIHSLDLSNNELNIIPVLQTMENLQDINLSNNVLITAKLSNSNDLPSLTKIDLSNNNINQITIDNGENIYRNLRQLNISYNYLVQIPESIFDEINNLQILDLSNNYIENLTPITFEGIKKLISLDLSRNRITDINASLFRFTELQTLDLSNNKITHVKGLEFDKLRSLTYIKLDHNSICSIGKSSFNNLAHLTTLILNNNKLVSLDKDTFLNNIALNTIDLSNNKFTTLEKNLFKNNLNIVRFLIYGNLLKGALVRGTFEGLKSVTEIDLRNQNITSIEDLAFLGLDNVSSILLNHNQIRSLSKKSFNNLKELNILDLSNNKIGSIDFEKSDLIQLQSLLIKDNNLTQISHEQFLGLNRLQFLDISNNNISRLESNSFHSLENLITFQISNNPLGEIIVENTFEGLNSLPTLDISHTLITSIHNSTFKGMLDLKDLNISHSKLKELQFNCFLYIDSIEKIDLSYNFLTSFDVNTTGLLNLNSLLLNNNLIKFITSNSFIGLHSVTELNLAYNEIEFINDSAFNNQKDLRFLDLSHNIKFKFRGHFIRAAKDLQNLIVSNTNSNLTFSDIGEVGISSVDLSELKITNISELQLKELRRLNTIIIKHNEISKLNIGDFANLTNLINMDISYNKITFIQPGTFKENTRLEQLNISHNSLTTLAYGIFRGLNYLNTLDVSYNFVNSLEFERFYEVPSLNILIADHNLITGIDIDEYSEHSLTLSIGENPLPCEVLVKLNKQSSRITITAIALHDNESENVNGVSCNIKKENGKFTSDKLNKNYDTNILNEIKDILTKISNKDEVIPNYVIPTKPEVNLTTFVNNIDKSFNDSSNNLSNNMNITAKIFINEINDNFKQMTIVQTKTSNETNIILNKILNILSVPNVVTKTTTTPLPVIKENATFESVLPYLNKINHLEDAIAKYKQSVIANFTDLSSKISYLNSQLQSRSATTDIPKHEKLVSTNKSESKSYFTETCVSMILLILIGFILFKVYKSKVFIRKRWSLSTNQLPDAIENSNL